MLVCLTDPKQKEFDARTRATIKSQSPFTEHYVAVEEGAKKNYSSDDQLDLNPYFNPPFLVFIQKEYMPYAFIWSGFVFRGLPFKKSTTHLTDGSIEKTICTRKALIDHALSPAEYINTTCYPTLGQCSSKRAREEDGESNNSDDEVEQNIFNAVDIWRKKVILNFDHIFEILLLICLNKLKNFKFRVIFVLIKLK